MGGQPFVQITVLVPNNISTQLYKRNTAPLGSPLCQGFGRKSGYACNINRREQALRFGYGFLCCFHDYFSLRLFPSVSHAGTTMDLLPSFLIL